MLQCKGYSVLRKMADGALNSLEHSLCFGTCLFLISSFLVCPFRNIAYPTFDSLRPAFPWVLSYFRSSRFPLQRITSASPGVWLSH